MTDAVAIALAASAAPTLLALATLIQSLRNTARIAQVQGTVDGLGDKRNDATQKSAHAEGVLDEKNRAAASGPMPVDVINTPDSPVPTKTIKP